MIPVPTSLSTENSLEEEIYTLGNEIFTGIGTQSPSTFDKKYWAALMMEWSMLQPGFKINMFRLVDVLPTLRSSKAVARHVQEYLGNFSTQLPGLGKLGSIVEWGLRGTPGSLRSKVVALGVRQSVSSMASLFIAGESPRKALKPLRSLRAQGLSFTVDLLGEFSVSEREAEIYVDRYLEALEVLGREVPNWTESAPLIPHHPGEQSAVCISVKLTALYSQCGPLNFERSVQVLVDKLSRIARKAKEARALMYVDAEDSASNPIIYETFKRVFGSPEFCTFPYPGIVVQAYAKEARSMLLDLLSFAEKRGAPIAVRLVKGAYWDSETILSLQNQWPSPLFAHKESSDANFEELSRILIDNHRLCLPAFGSHNIRSLAHACRYAESKGLTAKDFELQMLYGMAEPIAKAFSQKGYLVRMYVPLGDMIVGMGYLVRRLLENTSNESFLKHAFYDSQEVKSLLKKPEIHPKDR